MCACRLCEYGVERCVRERQRADTRARVRWHNSMGWCETCVCCVLCVKNSVYFSEVCMCVRLKHNMCACEREKENVTMCVCVCMCVRVARHTHTHTRRVTHAPILHLHVVTTHARTLRRPTVLFPRHNTHLYTLFSLTHPYATSTFSCNENPT